MLLISEKDFISQAKQYSTIPVSASIFADTITPIQLFHLFDEEASFLLESNDPTSPWSNYSFIGLNPLYTFHDEGEFFYFKNKKGEVLISGIDFQQTWTKAIDYINISPSAPDLPFPGGAVGYLGFEAYGHYEPRLASSRGERDISFIFCETILAYHHQNEELTVVHLQNISGKDHSGLFTEAKEKIELILKEISHGKAKPVSMKPVEKIPNLDLFENVRSNYTKSEYMKHVEKIKDYIAAGDIFQAVLSQRFETEVTTDGLSLYRVLRKVNPSPYLYYIRMDNLEVIGSSPERLVKVDESKHLEIHPIAGTRKRGANSVEDAELAKDLLQDKKELAEHLMLVDLARNDIGKVSRYGSVEVKDMMEITYFSHVMHITTKVTGKLADKKLPFEALFSAHPAGTVSGAPKVRAVEIIQELENNRRGIYAGAIAYCGFNEVIDSCIAIRTIVLKNGVAYVQAGAGIVQDSVPELEWEETRSKASALLYAIKLAEKRAEKVEVQK